jgi:ribosomal protein S13
MLLFNRNLINLNKKKKTVSELTNRRNNILFLIKIKCYRGFRLKIKLPCRGQRTRTNAVTAKKLYY